MVLLLPLGVAFAAARPAAAQPCAPPPAALARLPVDPPADPGFPDLGALETMDLGVGHLHPSGDRSGGPPGDNGWVQRVALPLSASPGDVPGVWIARGWIGRASGAPEVLSFRGMIETGYEEVSLLVLERRDGWLRVRYAGGERAPESAWAPECALGASPVPLTFSPWSEWLLGDEISPLFVRDGLPLTLHAEPLETSASLAPVVEDDVLEPHEVRGAWMRVTLRQPSDYCSPDVVTVSREGWVRWLTEDRGPRLWYFTRGC